MSVSALVREVAVAPIRCEGRYNYSVPAGLKIAGAFTRTVAGAVGVAGA